MTSDVTDVEGTEVQTEKRPSQIGRQRDGARRKRSLASNLRRHWRQLTKPRNLMRVAAVALPLYGFFYVSVTNGVLTWGGETGNRVAAINPEAVPRQAPSAVSGDVSFPATVISTDSSAPESASEESPSVTRIPTSGDVATVDPVGNDVSSSVETAWASNLPGEVGATAEVAWFGTGDDALPPTATERERGPELAADPVPRRTPLSDAGSRTYPVNEGGSLWRTGRNFLPDDVVLDRLIDNLAASGMNVRRVFPGAEFQVQTVSNGHLLVRIDHGLQSYVSNIIDGRVSTSVRRPVNVEIESTFVSDAPAVGLEDDVVSEILARDEDLSLGVNSARPGDHVRVELRETRKFGSDEKTTDIVWIEKNGQRLWREPSTRNTRTAALGE